MYFSATEFYNFLSEPHNTSIRTSLGFPSNGPVHMSAVRRVHKKVHDAITRRDSYIMVKGQRQLVGVHVGKWHRPWEVVRELREFQVPQSDYGVGIEIELGFSSHRAAQRVAEAVKRWKYVALDFEGGDYPIEATFAPTLYSKFNSKSQACRYLKLVEELGGVYRHSPNAMVGTHVNVSAGGNRDIDAGRVSQLSRILFPRPWDPIASGQTLTDEETNKYFGRRPYGGAYNHYNYIEYKLFNSTTDWRTLRRYVDIAVALTELVVSSRSITRQSVLEALELGYNRR